MLNLSTADETDGIATSGVLRHSKPLQSAAPEVLESSSEEGEIREDPGHGKRRHSSGEQSPAKRIKGVNDLNPFGTSAAITEGWMVKMFIDPGRFGSPSIVLGLSKDGEKHLCRSTWDVDAYIQGEWAINDINFNRLHGQDSLPLDKSNYRALMACAAEERPLLFLMKFRSWKRVIGFDHLSRKESAEMPTNLRRSMRAIFNPEDSYTLTIWFKAPYDVVLFQRNCLGLFTRALVARKPPLYGFVDHSGQRFTISRNQSRKKYFASTEDQEILAPKFFAASDFRVKGKPDGFMYSIGDTVEDFNMMDQSATPLGTNPRLDPHPEPQFSPNNRTPPLIADRRSEAALLDLDTGPKGSAILEYKAELILTTERSSSTPPCEETTATFPFSFLPDESPTPPRKYSGIVPSFLFGSLHTDDDSDEGNGGSNGNSNHLVVGL